MEAGKIAVGEVYKSAALGEMGYRVSRAGVDAWLAEGPDGKFFVNPIGGFEQPTHYHVVKEDGSLYQALLALNVPMSNHESDLYVPDTPEVRAIIAQFGRKGSSFVNQTNGERWLDIPFAYEPWWEKRVGQSRAAAVSGTAASLLPKEEADVNAPPPASDLSSSELPKMSLSQIAERIYDNWGDVSPYAAPYLEAMLQLQSIKDPYGEDSGASVVAYFLANAASWKGDFARAVKKELNSRLKMVYRESSAEETAEVNWDDEEEAAQFIARNLGSEKAAGLLGQWQPKESKHPVARSTGSGEFVNAATEGFARLFKRPLTEAEPGGEVGPEEKPDDFGERKDFDSAVENICVAIERDVLTPFGITFVKGQDIALLFSKGFEWGNASVSRLVDDSISFSPEEVGGIMGQFTKGGEVTLWIDKRSDTEAWVSVALWIPFKQQWADDSPGFSATLKYGKVDVATGKWQ